MFKPRDDDSLKIKTQKTPFGSLEREIFINTHSPGSNTPEFVPSPTLPGDSEKLTIEKKERGRKFSLRTGRTGSSRNCSIDGTNSSDQVDDDLDSWLQDDNSSDVWESKSEERTQPTTPVDKENDVQEEKELLSWLQEESETSEKSNDLDLARLSWLYDESRSKPVNLRINMKQPVRGDDIAPEWLQQAQMHEFEMKSFIKQRKNSLLDKGRIVYSGKTSPVASPTSSPRSSDCDKTPEVRSPNPTRTSDADARPNWRSNSDTSSPVTWRLGDMSTFEKSPNTSPFSSPRRNSDAPIYEQQKRQSIKNRETRKDRLSMRFDLHSLRDQGIIPKVIKMDEIEENDPKSFASEFLKLLPKKSIDESNRKSMLQEVSRKKLPKLSLDKEIYEEVRQSNYLMQESFEWIYLTNKHERMVLEELRFQLSGFGDDEDESGEEDEYLNPLLDQEYEIENELSTVENIDHLEEDEDELEVLNPFFDNGNNLIFPKGEMSYDELRQLSAFIRARITLKKIQIGSYVYRNCISGKSLVNLLWRYGSDYLSLEDCIFILERIFDLALLVSVPYNENTYFEDDTDSFYRFHDDEKNLDLLNGHEMTLHRSIGSWSPHYPWMIGAPKNAYLMIVRIEMMLTYLYSEHVKYGDQFIDLKGIFNSDSWKLLNYEATNLRKIHLKPFLINLYNMMYIHSSISHGVAQSNEEFETQYETPYYMVGRYKISLADIKMLLRGMKNDSQPFLTRLSVPLDPKIHFCLTSWRKDSPMPRVFTIRACDLDIVEATTRYVSQHTKLNRSKNEMYLPSIMYDNCIDFGFDIERAEEYIQPYIDKNKQRDLEKMKSFSRTQFVVFWSTQETKHREKQESVVTFEIIIRHPKYRQIFKEFCRLEYSEENVILWEQVQEYKAIAQKFINNQQQLPSALMDRARLLALDFLRKGAKYELNIAESQINEVEDIISLVNMNGLREISANLFDDIEKSVILIMNDAFFRFTMGRPYEIIAKDYYSKLKSNFTRADQK